jgi:hypothetical protein
MNRISGFSRIGPALTLLVTLLLTACAGTRPENTPRLDSDLFHTVVFRYQGMETGRLAEKTQVGDFLERLNGSVADTSKVALKTSCRISLLGREGTQTMRAQGDRFSLSGAGCRFGQSHCRYKAGFDVEALCLEGWGILRDSLQRAAK